MKAGDPVNTNFGLRVLGAPLSRGMTRRERVEDGSYASPAVSNITASSASRADLPAQTTNWKAW